jgi:mRNA-degrading endonuclease RelE of RelBE toxin-antitoxin system
LAENWLPNLQLKRLSNYKLANYRLRVWNYRVLFDIDDENIEIMVFRILHRSKLY